MESCKYKQTPQGINQFPVSPAQIVVLNQRLPNVDIPNPQSKYGLRHINRSISIRGTWERVAAATVTPNAGFSQTKSITTGTSTSTNYEVSASVTASADFLFASVEASVSTTFGQSFTWDKSETVSQTFNVNPPSKGEVTVCWWQAKFETTYTYDITWTELTIREMHWTPEFALAIVNVMIGGRNPRTETFESHGNDFASTQYPSFNRNSVEYNKFDLKV